MLLQSGRMFPKVNHRAHAKQYSTPYRRQVHLTYDFVSKDFLYIVYLIQLNQAVIMNQKTKPKNM